MGTVISKVVATEVEIKNFKYMNYVSIFVADGLEVPFSLLKEVASQYFCPYNECYKSLVFGDEFLVQVCHLKSHQRCSAGIRTWLSADQSGSSTLTES